MIILDKHGNQLSVGSYVFNGEVAGRVYAIESETSVSLLVKTYAGADYRRRHQRGVDPATLEFIAAPLLNPDFRRALAFTPNMAHEDLDDAA